MATAKCLKAKEEWERAGRPPLRDFAVRSGYSLGSLFAWSAGAWKQGATTPPVAPVLAAEPLTVPSAPLGAPEFAATAATQAPAAAPSSVKEILEAGVRDAVLFLWKVIRGEIQASAARIQAAERWIELAGHVPPKRSELQVTAPPTPRERVRGAGSGLTLDRLAALRAAIGLDDGEGE